MKTVLLTDDNQDMVDLVKLVLADSGYKLITATDGNEAVSICLEKQPDLVLMDIRMPNMDGFSASKTLRARGFNKPIVILSASDKEQDRRRAIEVGCNEYILKTMDMAEVETVLDKYLAESGGL